MSNSSKTIFIKNKYIEALNIVVRAIDLSKHVRDVITADVPQKYQIYKNRDLAVEAICCPFHNDPKPSFSQKKGKNYAYCFGCKVGGNVVRLHMNYLIKIKGFKDVTMPIALKDIAKYYVIPIPEFEIDEVEVSKEIKTIIKDKIKNRNVGIKSLEEFKNNNFITNKQIQILNNELINSNIDIDILTRKYTIFDNIVAVSEGINVSETFVRQILINI